MAVFSVHTFDQPAEELPESDLEGLCFPLRRRALLRRTSALRSGRGLRYEVAF
ncbi:MAG: hypothetical protein ACI9KE_006690, partial [Polyangiales bacterium]